MLGANGYVYDLLQELGLSDFAARTGQFLLGRPLAAVLILIVAVVVSRLSSRLARRWVESVVARSALSRRGGSSAGRARALASVSASMVRAVVWTVAALLVLGQIGIDLGPFIAGASVLGFAVGFGAQSLVKDYLSGFFILAEDQYGIGDLVMLGDTSGTVEEVTLRVTRLRSVDGTVWFVPNGEIRKVGNSAKEWSRAIVDVVLPRGADVNAAGSVIDDEMAALSESPEYGDAVLEKPEVLGVEAIEAEGTTMRISVRTPPEQRARVAREIRTRIAARLRADGIVTAADTTAGAGATASDD